jgi:predicted glycogen debranching enzyme
LLAQRCEITDRAQVFWSINLANIQYERHSPLTLGRQICGTWNQAASYEWLVTNGLGGYACGTVALANTRRYHGFLMASLAPPVARTLLVAKIDVSVLYRGIITELSANEYVGGAVSPQGFVHLESFAVLEGIPTWRFCVADALLEQQIFMAHGANTSYLRLELIRGGAPMRVTLKPFVTYREYHSHARGAQPLHIESDDGHCSILAHPDARPFRLLMSRGQFAPAPSWYWNFWHREEASRGLDATEDLLTPGDFSTELLARTPEYLIATAESAAPIPGTEVLAACQVQSRHLTAALPESAPEWIRTLARASDQFIVRRAAGGASTGGGGAGANACSVIAGYPWFADWGRDSMISLPGLATLPRRFDIAAGILKTFASFVDAGMLPNRFPDGGEPPEYNTADATLWMFHALDDYLQASGDPDLGRELFPTLMGILRAHAVGTRFGIKVDAGDGLLHAGEAGSQLTWMDAKHGDTVFTPRAGKPVEINALWLNALDIGVRLAGRLRKPNEKRFCQALLERASAHFGRFWNEQRGCLYDVIDAPGLPTNDARVRPNQILAISLPYCVLAPEQMRAVVDTCAQELLTSYGLRTLSPKDSGYIGRYEGDAWQRDAAYHMGTAWAWLLGPFARAHYRVYGDARLAQSFLGPIAEHVESACIGTVSEIFDGDAPHSARGCFAQAWSVAEILRAWVFLERKISKTKNQGLK